MDTLYAEGVCADGDGILGGESMSREGVVQLISEILDGRCAECPKRKELNKLHGSAFSRIDNHCNKECRVGSQLQELGKKLSCFRGGLRDAEVR